MGKVVTIEFEDQEMANRLLGTFSDGVYKTAWHIKSIEQDWHTPHELYEHRYTLFRALVFTQHKLRSWMSKQHHDGTMFEDSFIVGLYTPDGPVTYHLPLSWWDRFVGITEYERAPEWDGCTPEEGLVRLNKIVDYVQNLSNLM